MRARSASTQNDKEKRLSGAKNNPNVAGASGSGGGLTGFGLTVGARYDERFQLEASGACTRGGVVHNTMLMTTRNIRRAA